jgi:hypothetical protein
MITTGQNGKGKSPEKGRNFPVYRFGYGYIDWGHPKGLGYGEASSPSKARTPVQLSPDATPALSST